jgi:hypothetical protein
MYAKEEIMKHTFSELLPLTGIRDDHPLIQKVFELKVSSNVEDWWDHSVCHPIEHCMRRLLESLTLPLALE